MSGRVSTAAAPAPVPSTAPARVEVIAAATAAAMEGADAAAVVQSAAVDAAGSRGRGDAPRGKRRRPAAGSGTDGRQQDGASQVEYYARVKRECSALRAKDHRYFTVGDRLFMVHLYAHELHMRAQASEATGKRRRTGTAVLQDAYDVVAQRLGVGRDAVVRAWREYRAGRLAPYCANVTAAHASAAARRRILPTQGHPDESRLVRDVRTFVRETHGKQVAVTTKDVTRLLADRGYFVCSTDKQFAAAQRCTQRWLHQHGWRRGHGPDKCTLQETAAVQAQRRSYIAAVRANRAAPPADRLREVFVAETLLPLWPTHTKAPARGSKTSVAATARTAGGAIGATLRDDRPQCVVAAAVLGPDLCQAHHGADSSGDSAGCWWAPALAVKELQAASSTAGPRLCDGVDAAWFDDWFAGLCASLQAAGHKCLLVLAAEPHHKNVTTTSLLQCSDEDLLHRLRAASAAHHDAQHIWDKFTTPTAVRQFVAAVTDIAPTTAQLIAARHGHHVLYMPPFHDELHPMCHLWPRLERLAVAQSTSAATITASLRARLVRAAADAMTPTAICDAYRQAVAAETAFQPPPQPVSPPPLPAAAPSAATTRMPAASGAEVAPCPAPLVAPHTPSTPDPARAAVPSALAATLAAVPGAIAATAPSTTSAAIATAAASAPSAIAAPSPSAPSGAISAPPPSAVSGTIATTTPSVVSDAEPPRNVPSEIAPGAVAAAATPTAESPMPAAHTPVTAPAPAPAAAGQTSSGYNPGRASPALIVATPTHGRQVTHHPPAAHVPPPATPSLSAVEWKLEPFRRLLR